MSKQQIQEMKAEDLLKSYEDAKRLEIKQAGKGPYNSEDVKNMRADILRRMKEKN